ncbi:chromosome partitioning protein ParA [Methylomonas sp. Kb3]|uniref:ParA family protein n=1 Tax=Methylomonas sp. Kb3 TaxID=1611544 RepID=UPI000C329E31|nr:ParA family protein [Methylomonas sp. Kb3]PKD40497.1 chromosome partitioning protein ParA [Methylomonas sp. Kb3]
MKTLVTANQKGGVGKTATLVHIAFDFLERGLKVAVIDLDTQANASFTLKAFKSGLNASGLLSGQMQDYENASASSNGMTLIESDLGLANMEKMELKDAGGNFRAAIQMLSAAGYDVCLIDTAPSLGITMGAALLAADYVLSPIELEAYSIQGIKKMVTTIANIRKVNPALKFLGMVPSKVDGRNPRHSRHLAELTQAYPSLMVPTGIGLRSSIADALASGIPVWKINKTAARKASQEVRALAAHVYQVMEIK